MLRQIGTSALYVDGVVQSTFLYSAGLPFHETPCMVPRAWGSRFARPRNRQANNHLQPFAALPRITCTRINLHAIVKRLFSSAALRIRTTISFCNFPAVKVLWRFHRCTELSPQDTHTSLMNYLLINQITTVLSFLRGPPSFLRAMFSLFFFFFLHFSAFDERREATFGNEDCREVQQRDKQRISF